jgi:hypothetical protein
VHMGNSMTMYGHVKSTLNVLMSTLNLPPLRPPARAQALDLSFLLPEQPIR